ncbi:hypothetical protein ACFO9Q_19975 [Paenibacillus sp. GCM10023252]|uniref:hypothetical protein n=1 Tax=Paenibacillus sp. GCM10023252 TaxID=3252649 RepID=UPI00361E7C76
MADYIYEKTNKDLVTERDIDPEFGLFADETPKGSVRGSTEELVALYPDQDVIMDTRQRSDEEIPDADEVSFHSPVDPASPPDEFHGTDLLNGVGHDPEHETED